MKTLGIAVHGAGRHGHIRIERRHIGAAHRATLINTEVQIPALTCLPSLVQAEVRKHARAVLGRLLAHAGLDLRAVPRRKSRELLGAAAQGKSVHGPMARVRFERPV